MWRSGARAIVRHRPAAQKGRWTERRACQEGLVDPAFISGHGSAVRAAALEADAATDCVSALGPSPLDESAPFSFSPLADVPREE